MSFNNLIKEKESIKGSDKLCKHFDVVELDSSNEKYNLLTCKDRINRSNSKINFSVWLQLKIQKNLQTSKMINTWSDTEYIESCITSILDWIDSLKNFDKSSQAIQLSLFDEPQSGIVLEKLPNSPVQGEERAWNKYFNTHNRIQKLNLMKQYTFFELFNDSSSYWLYSNIDWRKFIPSEDEILEELKRVILKYKDNCGRYDDGWFDDTYDYITGSGALSDYELYRRVMFTTRLFFVGYKKYKHVSTDLSFSSWVFEESKQSRFWFDGKKLNYSCSYDNDKTELPSFDFFNPHFVHWLRETLKVPYADYQTDEEVLHSEVTKFMNSYFPSSSSKEFDWKEEISNSKTSKEFISKINKYYKEHHSSFRNGSSSLGQKDGYNGQISYDKKCEILIRQELAFRKSIHREINKVSDFGDNAIIYTLKGNEIYKKAYELHHIEEQVQTDLFDFI